MSPPRRQPIDESGLDHAPAGRDRGFITTEHAIVFVGLLIVVLALGAIAIARI